MRWQQFKPSTRLLFGPVFRRSSIGSFVCLFSLHSSHSLFLNHYKEFLALKVHGEAVPLSQNIQDAISEVYKDLMRTNRLSQQQLRKIDVIISKDAVEPFHKGNLSAFSGSFIGLPPSFSCSYSKTDEKCGEENNISERDELHQNSISWDESAVKYAIMKECILTDSHDIQVRTLLQALFLCLYSMTLQWNMYRFRQISVCLLYSVVWSALFGIALIQQWTFYKTYQDKQADEDVVSLGRDYVIGGLSYYNSIMQQSKGPCDWDRDQRSFNEKNHQTYFKKKEFFEIKLKEMNNNTQSMSE
ncbi:uncharacterized protein LOC125665520 [Ostrea edulis]|uniref:uncharacterized protein LOC125665520 n=1 Tax=Ostrea edulis TaxID=37623 RepID=UPI0024AEEDDF|nr:uncharacterized protein LOC125665520 [Ostrea edulis]